MSSVLGGREVMSLSTRASVISLSSLCALFVLGAVACSSKDDGGGTGTDASDGTDAAADAPLDTAPSRPDTSTPHDSSAPVDSSAPWHDPNDGSFNPDALPQSN